MQAIVTWLVNARSWLSPVLFVASAIALLTAWYCKPVPASAIVEGECDCNYIGPLETTIGRRGVGGGTMGAGDGIGIIAPGANSGSVYGIFAKVLRLSEEDFDSLRKAGAPYKVGVHDRTIVTLVGASGRGIAYQDYAERVLRLRNETLAAGLGMLVLASGLFFLRAPPPAPIRKASAADFAAILTIINDAAQAYKGVIPDDRWHEPYMPAEELQREIAAGVAFWVALEEGRIVGVMGIQDKGDVTLVRHAYVASGKQRSGVGTKLLRHLQNLTRKPVLIGTWAAAQWAIDFYVRNGFIVVSHAEKEELLRKYWSIPARQVETSVVLRKAA